MNIYEKISSYWHTSTAIFAAAVYVWFAQKDMPLFQRTAKVTGACMLGVSIAPELSERFGSGQNTTLVAVITLGWVVLDATTTLFQNRQALLDLVAKIVRGGK